LDYIKETFLRSRGWPTYNRKFVVFLIAYFTQVVGKTRAVMDAVRTRDNLPVMLKRVFTNEGPYELSITQRFSSPELARDPRNHCVLLLDVIELPMESSAGSHKVMVFPLLRPFNSPRFQTFGELIAFFTQICEVAKIPPLYILSIMLSVVRPGSPIYA
jgi:hypothetical protein